MLENCGSSASALASGSGSTPRSAIPVGQSDLLPPEPESTTAELVVAWKDPFPQFRLAPRVEGMPHAPMKPAVRSRSVNDALVQKHLAVLPAYKRDGIFSRVLHVVDDGDKCDNIVKNLCVSKPRFIALDLEWSQQPTAPKVGMVQIATDEWVVLYRPLDGLFSMQLRDLLTDSNVLKFSVGTTEDVRRMQEQFNLKPTPLFDLGLLCFKLDPAHWEARQQLGEKVMVGSTGGPWVGLGIEEKVAALKETWKNDLWESARGFVGDGLQAGVGLQALVARTLGRYLAKEVRERMGKGTVSLEARVLDESILDYSANDVCAVYDCLAVLAWLQNHGKEYLLNEQNKYAQVSTYYKAPVPLPTLPILPVATESTPPVLSSVKLDHMKTAICLILLDEELTGKDEVQAKLDTLYGEVKGGLSVQKGRKRFVDSGITAVTDAVDKRFDLVGTFLTDAKNNRDAGRGA